MEKYKYETHCHTSPVSRCAKATVKETLEFYKNIGYSGVFITNHFIDGNVGCDNSLSYLEKLDFYFSDYSLGVSLGKELGIKVFLGVELSYLGTDFLIYGLDKTWYYSHPEIMQMDKNTELKFMQSQGAFVVHAHPYREDHYIDHIRLYPRSIDGVEVVNAQRKELENKMAEIYATNYGFYKTAGSDNHIAERVKHLAGMEFESEIKSENDFISKIKNGDYKIFTIERE